MSIEQGPTMNLKSRISKRSAAYQIGALAIAAMLAGCGGGGGGGGGGSAANPVADDPAPLDPTPLLPSDQVQTEEGVYQGIVEGQLRIFRGVRYAAPPVGDLRFQAPAAPVAFDGTEDATAFGPNCLQGSNSGPVGEEDCLFLNVWAHDDDTQRPVIVFLHGGSGNGVGGDLPTSEGSLLAEHANVIAVTLNRRMSALGNLALAELIAENPRNTAGNYSVLDIIAALQWLKDNVAAFNGDPARIMLTGESAGGLAVCHVLAAPEAAGLFSAAAIQSGPCSLRIRLNDQVALASYFDTAINLHRPIVAQAGCDQSADVLACLRDLPGSEIVDAAEAVNIANVSIGINVFSPIVDGVVVQSDPHSALMNETVGGIPIIVGATADEAVSALGDIPVADDAAYRDRLALMFGAPLDTQIYNLYPTADFASASEAFLTFWGDWIFNCEAEELARSAASGAPAYLYTFSRGFSSGSFAGRGAIHGIDVLFLFETYAVFDHTPDADDVSISTAMQNAWGGLAANPTAPPPYLPEEASAWPAFDIANVQIVNFDVPVALEPEHRLGRCSGLRDLVLL
jgi:para-nitrobenzyl esterase